MSSYLGRHAELYDTFYGDKPYSDEAAFVHQCFQKFGKGQTSRLLELACGTGSHALVMERFGYSVLGIDYSADMLVRAREKGGRRGSRVEFRQQNMCTLGRPEILFDGVYCLFDSIGYVCTNEALLKVLQGVKRSLRSDGLFVFEFWHAAAMLKWADPIRVRRWTVPGGEVIRISETTLDCVRQTASVTYSVYELGNDGKFSTFKETQINRFFLVQEMAGWLAAAQLTPLKWFAGFTKSEQISDATWHVVAVARA